MLKYIFQKTDTPKDSKPTKISTLKSVVHISEKPRIIDHVLKAPDEKELKDMSIDFLTDIQNNGNTKQGKNVNNKSLKSNSYLDDYTKEDSYRNDHSFTKKTDEVYNIYKTRQFDKYHDSDMKRAKSLAELDLGNAVAGKVKQMVIRIKSVDKLDGARKEVIDAREKPRRGSVSERIALFEVSHITSQVQKLTRLGSEGKRPFSIHACEVTLLNIRDESSAKLLKCTHIDTNIINTKICI